MTTISASKKISTAFVVLISVSGFSESNFAVERPTYGINQKLYKKLESIERSVAEEQSGDTTYQAAVFLAAELLNNCTRCNPYELAILNRYLAWLHFQLEDMNSTLTYYQSIVDLSPEIPLDFEQDALLALGKLNFQEGNYLDAIDNLDAWKELTTVIPAEIYELEARIHYVMESYGDALSNIDLAISLIEKTGRVPQETWYKFQRNLYYRNENFTACLAIQRKLVEHYSKDAHWRELAVFYGLVGDEAKQISAYDVAWLLKGTFTENDILNFSWLLQNADYPYKAARVLKAAMEQGVVAKNSKNLQLLARAWYLSHEHASAIAVMESAAAITNDGNVLAFLADLYMEADSYEAAIQSVNRGLSLGQLRSPGRLHLTKGIALLELRNFDAAEASFTAALADKNSSETAGKWLLHLKNERLRNEQLNLHL